MPRGTTYDGVWVGEVLASGECIDLTREGFERMTLKECKKVFSPSSRGNGGVSNGVIGEMNHHARASLANDAHHIAERAIDQRIERKKKRNAKRTR